MVLATGDAMGEALAIKVVGLPDSTGLGVDENFGEGEAIGVGVVLGVAAVDVVAAAFLFEFRLS